MNNSTLFSGDNDDNYRHNDDNDNVGDDDIGDDECVGIDGYDDCNSIAKIFIARALPTPSLTLQLFVTTLQDCLPTLQPPPVLYIHLTKFECLSPN